MESTFPNIPDDNRPTRNYFLHFFIKISSGSVGSDTYGIPY